MYKGAIIMNHPLPRGWQEVKLGDIAEIIMGQSPQSEFYNKDKKGLPFLQGSSTFGYIYPTFDMYSSDIKKVAKDGSILMSVRAPVGDINIANTDICIGRGLCSINSINKSINSYIFYILKYNKNKLLNNQKGTTFGAITKDDIINFNIILPPIDEQKRIAEVLSLCDKLIENLNKLIEKKEIYKKGVMQRVLTGKVRFNGFKDEWREINLRDIVEEYSIPNTNKLKQYTIGKNGIKELDDFRHSIDKHKVFKKNDLIVGIGIDEINVNINLDYGCCSPVYRVYSINTNLLNPKFGYFYIRKAIDRIKNKITRKSTRREFEFDHKEFIKYSILLPSLEEQNKIAELLTLIDQDIDNLKQLLHLRKLQKKGLMQKLLTGEVRI